MFIYLLLSKVCYVTFYVLYNPQYEQVVYNIIVYEPSLKRNITLVASAFRNCWDNNTEGETRVDLVPGM